MIHLAPTLFHRHNRPLHALSLESQVWLCARDLCRLAGLNLHYRLPKLDPDQYRTLSIERYGEPERCTFISECGAYTLLARHHIPDP